MRGYDTNLVAEFHVLSVLHRLGADATLTLGNKKSVDIVVAREAGHAVTIDVKGVSGRYHWPAGNVRARLESRHFLALVSFEGQIRKPDFMPRVWVVLQGHRAIHEAVPGAKERIPRPAFEARRGLPRCLGFGSSR